MAEEDSSEIVKEQSESLAAKNLVVLGDGPTFFQNQAFAESNANQMAMNNIRMTLLGKIAESVIATSPAEGGTDVVGMGILAKILQGTPPPTNLPTQGTVQE